MTDFATKTHQRIRIPGLVDPLLTGFSPLSIEGCQVWLAANFMTGFSNDDPVSTWADLSENSNDFTQGTGGEQPLYKTSVSGINGLPAVRFDTNDGLIGTYSLSNPSTIFIVYDYQGAGNQQRRAFQGNSNWLIGPYQNSHQMYNGAFINGGSITNGVFIRARAEQQSSGGEFFVDGTSKGSNGNGNTPGTGNLGAEGAFGEPLDGHVAELIIYDTILATSDSGAVETYLANKYGIL